MKFNYQARTRTGEIQLGEIEASGRESALNILKSYGLFVTLIEDAKVPIYARRITFLERTSRKDIVIFSRQLAIMFKAKVPLIETLETLAKQTRNQNFKEKILRILKEVEGGMSLSKALSIYPKTFSSFYVNMVKSGEMSGKLVEIFNYLAGYLEKEQNFKEKIRAAMVYPIFVLFVFTAVVLLIVLYVIPQLSVVLEQAGQELPFITQVVINSSNFLQSNILLILFFLVVLGIVAYKALSSEAGKWFLDEKIIRIPIIGTFFQKLYLARIALNLSTLISGGLPITQALEITGEVVGNNVYKEIILVTRDEVKKGESLGSTFERYPNFISPFFLQMTIVGEKTGAVDSSLKNIVSFYEEDINKALEAFIKILEPLLIVFLGLIVGGLMATVLLPIYSIGGGGF